MKLWGYIAFVLILCVSGACRRGERDLLYVRENTGVDIEKDRMEKANQALLRNESERIVLLIERSAWKMEKTEFGLYYDIYEKAKDGAKVEYENAVVISGSLKLLNGQEVYNFDKEGAKAFVIGKGQAELGLEQAVLMMRKGDRARLIIPSHLAYGLLGDGDRIPARATLLYDIKIENVYEPPKGSKR